MKRIHETLIAFEDYRLPSLGHAISGAVGSAIANLCVYPLDIATTRLQLESQQKDTPSKTELIDTIVTLYQREGGFQGLYAGLGANTLASVLSSFTYFYCYTALRNIQEKLNKRAGNTAQLNIAQELFLGAEAALFSRLFTTPISNISTRLQTVGYQNRQGFLETVKTLYAERGLSGFWTGYRASMVLVSNPSITYFLFEKMKDAYVRRSGEPLSSLKVFLLSAIAKAIATAATYPFIFARTKMVADIKGKGKEGKKQSMISIFKQVLERDGLRGIYKGVEAQIIKGFFNQGIMYMIKDYVATYLTLVFYTSLKIKFKRQQRMANIV
ncbi:mitochondrial carrier domain-containing protein [Spinellus fusiger]|nr:mitochondrial carrier domain-containing protein [Spinellus fusiger]